MAADDVRIHIPPANLAADLAFADKLTISPGLARLLRARALGDVAAAQAYLFPKTGRLTPPADIPDLAAAAELLCGACARGERIFVAGDYDVDGLAATTLLTLTLQSLGANVLTHIPNRLSEGYDLTDDVVARAAAAGAATLVTVDCGSRAHGAVLKAKEAGLRIIVTDHHRLAETLPAADAVVTSQRLPENHPARGLAGVGVAYKLAEAILAGSAASVSAAELLPLVALGTVCDVVDLTGENRTLVATALADFPGTSLPGLTALMREAGINAGRVRSWHLAYVLGPRLNAAGRLGHAEYALRLLMARDDQDASALARRLEDFNRDRRALEDTVAAGALTQAAAQYGLGRHILVCIGEGWHPGVIGIVASRVAEKFYRPAILISLEGEEGRGSCRSIPPFDIHEALASIQGRLRRFGGHRQAAGFEIAAAEVQAFNDELEAYAGARLGDADLRPSVRVDGWVPLTALTAAFAEDTELLEPVGQGNEDALFYARALANPSNQRVFKNSHLEIQAFAGPVRQRAIGFNLATEGKTLPAGHYGLVYSPSLSSWGDRERLELKLKYISPAPGSDDKDSPSPTVTDRRGTAWAAAAGDLDARADAVFGLPTQKHLAGSAPFIPYGPPACGDRRFRKIFLAAPPGEPFYLAALAAACGELVFAYRDGSESQVLAFLKEYFPDRNRLEQLYREKREGRTDFDAAGERRARAIFEELGLDRDLESNSPARAEKIPLTASELFRRCERARETAAEFIAALAGWREDQLRLLLADLVVEPMELDI